MFEFIIVLATFLGLIISYEDFKLGIIRNIHIIIILLLGIFFQLVSGSLQTSFPRIVLTVGYGFGLSFLFWWLGLWPAGDAKLFSVFLLFFPVQMYFPFRLIFNYLVNVFVPIFFFMMVVIFFKTRLKLLKEAVKYSFDPYKIFMLITMFLGFVWFTLKLIPLIGIQVDFFVTILLLFLAFELFYSILTFESELLFLGCAIVRIILDYKNIFTFSFVYDFFSIVFVFIFFRFFILYLGYHMYTKRVKISDLEVGMSLAEGVFFKDNRIWKVSLLSSSFIEFLSQRKYKFIHDLNNLTKKDVKLLNNLVKEKKLTFDSILVSQRQHFAFFILLGFLLTLLLKGDFISFLALKFFT